MNQQLPVYLEQKPLLIEAVVDSIPEISQGSYAPIKKFDATILKIQPLDAKKPLSVRFKVRFNTSAQEVPSVLAYGDKFEATIKLKKPYRFANPGSFDIEQQYFLDNIAASAYLIKGQALKIIEQSQLFTVERIRAFIANRVDEFASLHSFKHAQIIKALTLGLRAGMDKKDNLLFVNTGTSHLMAISGLHIGLVAGLVFGMVQFILSRKTCISFVIKLERLQLEPSKLAALGALIASGLYALLAGFLIPTQRSFIMIVCFMGGMILTRRSSLGKSWSIALILVLLLDPLCVMRKGFWLSFFAVWLLLIGFGNRVGVKGLWWKFGRVHWILFLGMLPISLSFFGQSPLISPLANVISIPWVSFITVPSSLLGLLAIGFSLDRLAYALLWIAEKSLELLLRFLECLTQYAGLVATSISPLMLMISTLGMLIWLLPSNKGLKWTSGFLMLPLVLGLLPQASAKPDLKITFIDVGQGTAILVSTPNHHLLYDTGPPGRVMVPFLQREGISKLDNIMISHPDLDHIGGLSDVLEHYKTNLIMSQTSFKGIAQPFALCERGQSWTWDNVQFTVLHPGPIKDKKKNNQSCVLKIQQDHFSALLTGDIEAVAEQALIQAESKFEDVNNQENNKENIDVKRREEKSNDLSLKSTLLLVPHHGSKTSSTDEFIESVSPEIVVFTTGHQNKFGHPTPQVLRRYQSWLKSHYLYPQWYLTHETGALSFSIKQGIYSRAHPYRIENQRFYHQK